MCFKLQHTGLIICLLCLTNTILSAQSHDAVWLGGSSAVPAAPGGGHYQIRFTDSTVLTSPLTLELPFNATMMSLCDEQGHLLFYSNGCEIVNVQGQVLINGKGINEGTLRNFVCPELGYITPQSMLAFPWPDHPDEYGLLHMSIETAEPGQWRYHKLFFSRINLLDNAVTAKNQLLATGNLDPVAATRHGNGRDWWILMPEHQSNRFRRFLLEPNQLGEQPPLIAGGVPACHQSGELVFSPTGSQVARWTSCAIYLYDFDRCSGSISQRLELPAPAKLLPGGGLAFSPDGRFLYGTSFTTLFRADLSDDDPKLDTIVYAYDPNALDERSLSGASFQYMELAPDHRIYISAPGSAAHYHVIHFPNAVLRENIGFQVAGLPLPGKSIRSMPSYPNYRLFDWPGSPCDTLGINTPTAVQPERDLPERDAIRIWPNPAQEWVHFERTDFGNYPVSVSISDVAGGLIYSGNWPAFQKQFQVRISGPGIYFATITHGARSLQTLKFVIY